MTIPSRPLPIIQAPAAVADDVSRPEEVLAFAARSRPPAPGDVDFSCRRGLSSVEARLRLTVHGPNLCGGDGPRPAGAVVVRDGLRREIDATEIVPGDLMIVTAGDVLAADGRLVEGFLDCDLAAITGDHRPAARIADAPSVRGGVTAQRHLVFAGTVATSGSAAVLVRKTGPRTVLGGTPPIHRRWWHRGPVPAGIPAAPARVTS